MATPTKKLAAPSGPFVSWEKALTFALANAKVIRGVYPEWGNIPKLTNRDAAGLIYVLRDGEAYRLGKGVTAPWEAADWYRLALPALGWFHRGDKFDLSTKWQEHAYQPAFASELIAFLIRLADQLDRAHVPVRVLRDPRGTDALYRQMALEAYKRMQREDPESADAKPHKPAQGQGNKPTVKPPAVVVQPPAPSAAPPRVISTHEHDGDERPMLVPDKAAPPPPPIVVATPQGPALAEPPPPAPVVVPITQPAEQAEQAQAPAMPDDTRYEHAETPPIDLRPTPEQLDDYRRRHGRPPLDAEERARAERPSSPAPSSSAHDDDDDVRPARKKPTPESSSDGSAIIVIGLLLAIAASDD